MALFGFEAIGKDISMQNFQILSPEVQLGGYLSFSFEVKNASNKTAKIRLEYAIYYQKANGSLTRKVLKISENNYPANSTTPITRRHSFAVVTTRKLYMGLHEVSVIINGTELDRQPFKLIPAGL